MPKVNGGRYVKPTDPMWKGYYRVETDEGTVVGWVIVGDHRVAKWHPDYDDTLQKKGVWAKNVPTCAEHMLEHYRLTQGHQHVVKDKGDGNR